MNRIRRLTFRSRLLLGFLVAASMTVLAGVGGIVNLQQIYRRMGRTADGVQTSVRQQTEQITTAVHLKERIDAIRFAPNLDRLDEVDRDDLRAGVADQAETGADLTDMRQLLDGKRRELSARRTLSEIDQEMSGRLTRARERIDAMVDDVTLAVLLNVGQVADLAADQAEGRDPNGTDAGQRVAAYVDKALTKIKAALTVRASMLEVNLALKNVRLSQDPNRLAFYQERTAELYGNLRQQLAPLAGEEGLDEIETMVEALAQATPGFLAARSEQLAAAAQLAAILTHVSDDERRRDLTVVSSAANLEAQVRREFEGSGRFVRRALIILAAIALGAMVFSLLTGIHMARSLGAALAGVVSRVRDVAEGDLTEGSVEVTSADEIGALTGHFNVMVENLKGILRSTQEVAARIEDAGQEILTISDAQSAGAQEQSCAVSQTTSAAAELSKSSEQIGEATRAISEMAKHVLVGMEKIKEATDQTNQILMSLNEKSKQIGHITDLIDDVADQTNLLAVNASIEAARAGEQGRGFTVVADQIGKLADSTAKSTKDITSLIEMTQHEMSNAIVAMEQSLGSVEEEIQLAKTSAVRSHEIAANADQQISGSRQIAEAMASIDQTMKQIVFGAQRSSEAASQLTGLADELKGCISQFRVTHHVG